MRVLRLPTKLFLGMELEPFHCACRVMHELILRRQLHVEAHPHADKQRTHAQQLTGLRHVDDL